MTSSFQSELKLHSDSSFNSQVPQALSLDPHQQQLFSNYFLIAAKTNVMEEQKKPEEDWSSSKKNSHKEVEKRRREVINQGIIELGRIVPGGEKNKGKVIQRAVQYIQELKDMEASNLGKWNMEKMLCEQAIEELNASVRQLQAENLALQEQLRAIESKKRKIN